MIASIICGVITARIKSGSRGYSINWLEKQRATGRSGIDGLRSARQLGDSHTPQRKRSCRASLGIGRSGASPPYAVGKAPAATSTSTLLPLNWVEVIQVPAGSQISALSNDSSGGTLNVTELN